MKKVLLSILAMVAFAMASNAQSVIDADDGRNPNDFYQQGIVVGKRAMPYPYLRESDVVWRTTIWRKIDFNENFNQFFYFPFEAEKNTQGRINLVNLILQAVKNGSFEIYEDDDMKVPQDVATALAQTMSRSTRELEIGEDEWGEPIIQIDTTYGRNWWIALILGILLIACGIIGIFAPATIIETIGTLIGISIIISGANMIHFGVSAWML